MTWISMLLHFKCTSEFSTFTLDLIFDVHRSFFIPGVIEVLVNSGKQIDAVNLAFAFGLTEQFPPVALLKSYLTETRRSSSQGRPGNATPAVQASVP